MNRVSPQVPDRVPPGTLVTTLQAKDPDEGENGTILYTLTGMMGRLGKKGVGG